MMRLNNNSSSSVGSNKDKELPPIPSPLPSPLSNSFTIKQVNNDDSMILQTKTLKRKNFKQLSLDSASGKNVPTINEPDTVIDLDNDSLRQKRNKVRPAPLINLNKENIHNINSDNDRHNNHSSSHNNDHRSSQFNIYRNNRNIDPESQGSTDIIINQLSNLELANIKDDSLKLQRKRQTVISSISPTKSSSSSPSEMKHQALSFDSNQINLPDDSTPISTTSSIKLNNNDLLTLKNLGSGNSGTVSKILHIPTQKTMAKKMIHIESKSVIQTQIIRELRILHECHSPFIIEFYGAFININNTIVICMEYCNCGSLDKILPLCEQNQFPLFVLKKLAFAILSGLTYLYTTHKIIHRDVKPSNVLMTHKGEFKLCDFGVSRELTNSVAMADTFVGTSAYMSPERIQGLNYGVKSDVWSMGLMLIELASGSPVWSDDNGESRCGPDGILDLLQRIVNETPPTLTNKVNPVTHEYYDPLLCQFIDSCLIKDGGLRKAPWDLLQDKKGFLSQVEEGSYDKDVKNWAKRIRKLHKEKNEYDNS